MNYSKPNARIHLRKPRPIFLRTLYSYEKLRPQKRPIRPINKKLSATPLPPEAAVSRRAGEQESRRAGEQESRRTGIEGSGFESSYI
ncbi:MAG: hypothetical protein WD063_21355 [Pirellulales bacterium]